MHRIYEISDTLNLDSHSIYESSYAEPLFQEKLQLFKDRVMSHFEHKIGLSILKFGDGDYYFLKGKPVGSAKPGNRAISKKVPRRQLREWVGEARSCDLVCTELYPENRARLQNVLGRHADFPAEFIYGLVSSRWFTRKFGQELGLIGASEKLDIISELLYDQSYREYLGTQGFSSMIKVPQKFAADDPKRVFSEISEEVASSRARIFLLGVGHAKSYLLPALARLREDAIFIDVGSGIDALAGIVDTKRPYFGDWKNYHIPNDEIYHGVDYLQFNGRNRVTYNPTLKH